jgi:NifB/MoaA-like Fe-S oxidoreductase
MQVFNINKYFIKVDKTSEFSRLNETKQDYKDQLGLYYVSGVDEHNEPLYTRMTANKLRAQLEDMQEVMTALEGELDNVQESD